MDREEQDQERIEVKKEKNWVETEIKKTENETLRNKENGTTQDKWPGGVSGRRAEEPRPGGTEEKEET